MSEIVDDRPVRVSLTLRNAGTVPGREVVQIYVAPRKPGLHRPMRELKGFAKVAREPGEEKRVEIALQPRDFMYFDPAAKGWRLNAEAFAIEAAASSRDIRQSITLPCRSERMAFRHLSAYTQPPSILENEATAALVDLLSRMLAISASEARAVIELTRDWFLGVHQSLSWYVGDGLSVADVDAALRRVNERDRGAARKVVST